MEKLGIKPIALMGRDRLRVMESWGKFVWANHTSINSAEIGKTYCAWLHTCEEAGVGIDPGLYTMETLETILFRNAVSKGGIKVSK